MNPTLVLTNGSLPVIGEFADSLTDPVWLSTAVNSRFDCNAARANWQAAWSEAGNWTLHWVELGKIEFKIS